jgi:tetratricopeptide (TPR) repeat protein
MNIPYSTVKLFNLIKKNKYLKILLATCTALGICYGAYKNLDSVHDVIKKRNLANYPEYSGKWLAKAFVFFGKGEYSQAASCFENASSYASGSYKKEIKRWQIEAMYRDHREDEALELMKTEVRENDNLGSKDSFEGIAWSELAYAINTKKTHRIGKLIPLAKDGLIFKSTPENVALVHILLGNSSAADNYIAQNDEFTPDAYDGLRSQIMQILGIESETVDPSLSLLAFSRARKINFDSFDKLVFIEHFPLVNLQVQPLDRRKQFIDREMENLKKINNDSIYSKINIYEEIEDFMISIGSLQVFLNRINRHYPECANSIVKIPNYLSGKIPIAISYSFDRGSLKILVACGLPMENLSKGLAKHSIMGDIEFHHFTVSKNIFKHHAMEDKFYNPWDINLVPTDKGFFVVSLNGSGEFFGADFINNNTIKKSKIDLQKYNFYHASSVQYKLINNDLEISIRHEKPNSVEDNISRKVFYISTIRLSSSKLIDHKIKYPNPALELFETLDKSKMRLEQELLSKFQLTGKQVVDKELLNIVTTGKNVLYRRTEIDDVFNYGYEKFYPTLSALRLVLYGSDLDKDPLGEAVIIVKRNNDNVELIDGYRIKDDKLGERIVK